MRVVCDENGVGFEVAGLGGPEILYFARKPKDGRLMRVVDAHVDAKDVLHRDGGSLERGLPCEQRQDQRIPGDLVA